MNTHFVGTGRLGWDPELRFTSGGKAVLELRVAFSNSRKNTKTQEYEYTPPMWVSVTLWDKMAENAADILSKGDEVVATGSLEIEQFTNRAGEQQEKLVLRNAEVAPSIRRQKRGELAAARSDSRPAARSNGQARPAQARPQPVDPPARAGADYDPPPF